MEIRQKFDEKLSVLINSSADNSFFISSDEYNDYLARVKEVKSREKPRTTSEYRLLKRFDIVSIDRNEIKPMKEGGSVLYYAKNEELFDILNNTHVSVGHGGRNRMSYEIRKKFSNITRPTIMTYLKLCMPCQKNQRLKKKGLVSKPILHSTFNSRTQVNLIDMQS